MSILSALPIIGSIVGGPVEKIIDKLGEDDRREFELAMQKLDSDMQLKMAQIEVNQREAEHASIFVAGWRPFIGWCCGGIFIMSCLAAVDATYSISRVDINIEALNTLKEMMMPVLFGLLGLGGMRSFEKVRGVARASL